VADTTAVQGGDNPTPVISRVYLRDFAKVIDGTEEQRVFAFLNKKTPAVKVSIQKQPEANTITVVDGVKQQIQELRQSGLIPADMVITPTLDESRFIRNSLADVTNSAISGAVLRRQRYCCFRVCAANTDYFPSDFLYSSCHNFHEAVRADSECV